MTWIDTIAETSGHPTGGLTLLCVDTLIDIGTNIAKRVPVFGKGLRLVKTQKYGYTLAIGAMQTRFGPQALQQFRRISGECALGFDVGASIHAGQVVAVPPSNLTDPAALAGFYLAHGAIECPTRIAILKMAIREPEYRIGVAVAISSINNGRKGPIQKLVESVLGV